MYKADVDIDRYDVYYASATLKLTDDHAIKCKIDEMYGAIHIRNDGVDQLTENFWMAFKKKALSTASNQTTSERILDLCLGIDFEDEHDRVWALNKMDSCSYPMIFISTSRQDGKPNDQHASFAIELAEHCVS